MTQLKRYEKIKGILAFFICFIVISFFSRSVFASGLTPTDSFYVNDYVNILTEEQIDDMINRADMLADQNGVQVVAVITNNFIGESMAAYSNQVFNDFGIGSKDDNNGVLLIVAIEDGEMYIEVGDGLSALLPDSKVGTIRDEYFMPDANDDNIGEAVYKTYVQLITESSKLTTMGRDYSNNNSQNFAAQNNANSGGGDSSILGSIFGTIFSFIGIIIGIVILIIIFALSRSSHYGYSRRMHRGPHIPRRPFGRYHNPPPPPHMPPPPKNNGGSGGLFGSNSNKSSDSYKGGGGKSSGGGAGGSFKPSSGSFGGGGSSKGSFKGGGGKSSGGGAGGSFGKK